MLSEDPFEGGVRRLPTLTADGACWGALLVGKEENLCVPWPVKCVKGGGGNSKLGRLEAACRLAVRL
jgi:hypothetical protein